MDLFTSWMKQRFQRYRAFQLTREIKSCVHGYLKDLKSKEKAVVSLKGNGLFRGNVLLSYIIDAFLLKDTEMVPYSHSHYWESLQMAKTFQDLGYSVDVIHYTNTTFVPEKEYSVFIDVRWNMQRLAPLLNKDCIKIMHIDLCHMLFNNAAEAMRLLALQQRRKVTLQPRRFEMPNLGIEHADCGVVIGNKFTMNTFIYANKPLYRVPVFSSFLYPSPEGKDFGTSRRNFIWFGSGGLVRKGLDLVLEAFTAMPDYHLMVIGPVGQEKDFERAYHKELYETQNIHTIGWLDLSAPELTKIVKNCVGLIYPSCAEGQSGGVVICMHAGLIPIISYESGVDVEDFGVLLRDCSIEEIKNSIQMIAALPPNELKQRALKTWEYARANHTRDKFAEDYGRIVHEIVNKYRGRDLRGRLVRTALC